MNGYSADLQQVCGCSWAATGSGTDEVVSKVKTHAKESHGLAEVPPELVQKLQKAIRPIM
jgi:predicted small metal-binding protein